MEIHGSCLCGAVRFHLKAEMSRFYICHCSRCQKSTGSAHASNLFFKNGMLTWEQGEEICADYTFPGTQFSKRFCTRCASPLPHVIDDKNNIIQVPAGSLDGDQVFEPTAHIYTDSKKCWEDKLLETKRFPERP